MRSVVLYWLWTLLWIALSAVVIDFGMRVISGLVVFGVDYGVALLLAVGYVVWRRYQWAKGGLKAGEQENGNQEDHASQKRDARLRSTRAQSFTQ
jgi:hypothetical protein